MIQRAGIALSRLAYDADLSITRIDYDPKPTFSLPTNHKLVEGHTVGEIVKKFDTLVGFDTEHEYNGFAVSIPISASEEQRKAFRDASSCRSSDHFDAWVNGYAKDAPGYETYLNFLFIDLTPGQVASKIASGSISASGWRYNSAGDAHINLGDVSSLNTHTVYDKLVRSIVPWGTRLHVVGILRPEGAFPEVFATDLEYKFPNTAVKWVTLDDLSHGAAIKMSHEPTSRPAWSCNTGTSVTNLPIGITLASGKSVVMLPKGTRLPTKQKFFFTNAQDDQTTATIRLCLATKPYPDVTLERLIPRPRGQAAIGVKIMIGNERYQPIIVRIEEVGTGLKKVVKLRSMSLSVEAVNAASKAHEEGTSGLVEMVLGKDGLIGALPE
jgi:hypothetical protein